MKKHTLLLLDTSTHKLSAAISVNEEIAIFCNKSLHKSLSSSIITHINGLLKKINKDIQTIDGFGVGLGPGSFTSLRVGLSTVKAFCLALNKPVIGVSSLDIMALNSRQDDVMVCPVCDARRGQVYSAVYSKKAGRLKRESPYGLTRIDSVIQLILRKKISRKIVFLGNGLDLYQEALQKGLSATVECQFIKDQRQWYPQARYMGPLVQERLARKDFDNPDKMLPLYLYPEDCQVRKPDTKKLKKKL